MRRILSRVGSGYRAGGTILLNCIVCFTLANLAVLAFPDPTPDPFDPESHRNGWVQQHGIETMRRVYPGRSDAEIEQLVRNTGRFGQLFEPYIHTKSEPMVLSYLSFHEAGFRLVGRDQGPWPLSPKAVNIFTFGGSTTAGSGVSDGETFAALLQGQLRQRYGTKNINVYNFGTAGHYSTQERIYLEQLLLRGIKPDAAIFIDGLNDFYFWDDVPVHTNLLKHAFQYIISLANPRGLGEAVRLVLERLPVTNFVRRLGQGNASTFKMPTASLIGPAHADDNPLADRTKIDTVIERYFRFKTMTEKVAEGFNVAPVFVWQPVPLYKYDPKLRLVPVTDEHGRHGFGYPAMERAVAQRDMGRDFAWCADAFEKATQPMYIDAVHYSIAGNEAVATCIAQAVVDRGLIEDALRKHPSSPEPITTAENLVQPDALAGFRATRHATIARLGAPDGQQEYRLATAGSNSGHYVWTELSGIAPGTYTFSLEIRPEVAAGLRMHLLDSARSGAIADFHLMQGDAVVMPIREGIFLPPDTKGELSLARTEVTSDGWLRVSMTASFSAPNAKLYLCVLDRHGASSFRPTSEALRIRGLQLTNDRVTSAEPSQPL